MKRRKKRKNIHKRLDIYVELGEEEWITCNGINNERKRDREERERKRRKGRGENGRGERKGKERGERKGKERGEKGRRDSTKKKI